MTNFDCMNSNFESSISVSEMNQIADFMNELNNLDEAIWNKMKESMFAESN